MSAWKEIESAPKDGSIVTVVAAANYGSFTIFPDPVEAAFFEGKWRWKENGVFTSFEPQPTHWTTFND